MEVDGVAKLAQLRTQIRASTQYQGWLLMDDQTQKRAPVNSSLVGPRTGASSVLLSDHVCVLMLVQAKLVGETLLDTLA